MSALPADVAAIRSEAHFGDRVVRCFAQRPAGAFEMFREAVERNGGGEALVCADERYTWAGLATQVERCAAGLARRGIRAGDRIALLLANRSEFVVGLLAAWRLGAIAVPINVREQTPELAYVLNHCGAKLVVHETELATRLPLPRDTPALVHRVAIEPCTGSHAFAALLDPQATQRKFTGGYWHSGDLGSVDAAGFVRVLDRKKDLINRGGYKVYTAEVESALAEHPCVLEAAVVAKPCPVLGERVHAFVALRDATFGAAELAAHCAERLADYKVAESYTLRSVPLPRNANGKLLKRALRDELAATLGRDQ